LYDFNVSHHAVLSREDLVAETIDQYYREEYKIVDSPIAAPNLRAAMVLRIGGKLRVVISVRYKNNSDPVILIETSSGFHKIARRSRIDVWHIQGKPFIMTLPPNGPRRSYTSDEGGSTPPAHDAAGIVPVWPGPIRPN
jgi:hypothetical protein